MDAAALELVTRHRLDPHPEGGYYRRIHASTIEVEHRGLRRPASTAIRYLLPAGRRSAWHRVDADEAWHWQEGGVLELFRFDAGTGSLSCTRLGPGPGDDGTWCMIPAGTWQAARAASAAVLVTCSVSPGFAWQGFELLDPASATARELERRGMLAP